MVFLAVLLFCFCSSVCLTLDNYCTNACVGVSILILQIRSRLYSTRTLLPRFIPTSSSGGRWRPR